MTDKDKKRQFTAFKIKVDRQQAETICFEDFKLRIIASRDSDLLESIFLEDWFEPLTKWSDQEIQEMLDQITEEENIKISEKGYVVDPF